MKDTDNTQKYVRAEDLTGKIFSDLTVLERKGTTKGGCSLWLCKCICGKETIIRASDLRSGKTRSCGCLRSRKPISNDLTGQRFGELLVLGFSHKLNSRIFWDCICDCGNLTKCATATLKSGGAKRCYDCGRKLQEKPNGYAGLTCLIKQYKFDAKKRGHEWSLNRDEVKEITSKKCIYCGNEPILIMKTGSKKTHGNYIYNGIDRVDNTKGYTLDNCVSCCQQCNWMKMDLTITEFKEKITNIFNHFVI